MNFGLYRIWIILKWVTRITQLAYCLNNSMHGIIEGDQIQVAAFSLEYFSYLTRSPWANENASPIVWFVFNQSACFGALNACVLIEILKRKSSHLNLETLDNTSSMRRSTTTYFMQNENTQDVNIKWNLKDKI